MLRSLLPAAATALIGLMLAGPAHAGPVYVTTRPGFVPPPPARPVVVVQPARPAPNYLWVDGQWSWTGAQYVWVPGYWAPQPVMYTPAPMMRPVYRTAPVYAVRPAPPMRPVRPVVVVR